MSSLPRCFSDNTSVVVSTDSLHNLEIFLDFELSKINTWMNKNKLTIYPLKSYALVILSMLVLKMSCINIRFNLCRTKVTGCINYLGQLIDPKLFFNNHINMSIFKLCKAVGIINKLKYLFPSGILSRLHFCFIYFHLHYGIIILEVVFTSNILNPVKFYKTKLFVLLIIAKWNHKLILFYHKLTILNINDLMRFELAMFYIWIWYSFASTFFQISKSISNSYAIDSVSQKT